MSWVISENAQTQAQSLADEIGVKIVRLLEQQDFVTLCVPGGTTPALFLECLSHIDLEWSRVRVVLNDERWVPLEDSLSNEAMLRKVLLNNKASAAQIVSFYHPDLAIDEAVDSFNETIDSILPLDICVLGMGEDGHTASLFPVMENQAEALNSDLPAQLICARVEGKDELRVSFNLSALLSGEHLYVLIKGETKKTVAEAAMKHATTTLPISYIFAAKPVSIFFTEK